MSRQAEVMRRRRQDPAKRAFDRALVVRARTRAMRRLAREYPDRLEVLLNEERAKEGLPPVGELSHSPLTFSAAGLTGTNPGERVPARLVSRGQGICSAAVLYATPPTAATAGGINEQRP